MNIFGTKSFPDRMRATLQKAVDAKTIEGAYQLLEDAIAAEIVTVEKLQNMTGFRAWIDGQAKLDLAAVKMRARR